MTNELNEQVSGQCRHTVAFVFAPNSKSASGILESGIILRSAHMAAIFFMADASVAEEAVEAMRQLQSKGRGPLVQAAEFDFSVVYGVDTEYPQFRLEELPIDLLHVLKALAESVLDVYEYVLVVDASKPELSNEELEQLYSGIDAPDYDHPPYLITRSYLDAL